MFLTYILHSKQINENNLFPEEYSQNSCPESRSSLLSRLTVSWFTPMILKGYRQPLTTDDIWSLDRDKQIDNYISDYNKHYKKNVKRNVDCFMPILYTFWPTILTLTGIKLIQVLLSFSQPIILGRLLTYMSTTNESTDSYQTVGYLYAFLLFLSPLIGLGFLESEFKKRNVIMIMKIKSSLISLIYKKSIRLSSSGRKHYSTGEIINLLNNDMLYVSALFIYINHLLLSPIHIGIGVTLLWQQLGAASLAGMTVMLTVMGVNSFVTRREYRFWDKILELKDKRVKSIGEILSNIKILKLYAWEPAFLERVVNFRAEEMACLKTIHRLGSAVTALIYSGPFLVSTVSFSMFLLISDKNIFDANKAFVSFSLFNILTGPLTMIPPTITAIIMSKACFNRINKFLKSDEINEQSIKHEINDRTPVIVRNASFKWVKESNDSVLKDITLDIKKGSLVAVVGQVGSGKSSLLSTFLGDMELTNGSVNVWGTVAYVSQIAWIRNTTIKQNILFTNEYNKKLYNRVLDACALRADLKVLSAGDMTEIGEKGINLSGGQKQRVALARAVYSGADIYLLDDPLSAVDAHVSRQLFDETIGPNSLLKDKTRILVTHNLSILPKVDQIVVLKDGRISESGSFDTLIKQNEEFANFVADYLIKSESNTDNNDDNSEYNAELIAKLRQSENLLIANRQLSRYLSDDSSQDKSTTQRQRQTTTSPDLSFSENNETNDKNNEQPIPSTDKTNGKLIDMEKSETGYVKLYVYQCFLRLMGYRSFIIVVVLYFISHLSTVASGLWLSQWSNDAFESEVVGDISLRYHRLLTYCVIGLIESICMFVGMLSLRLIWVRAAQNLHNNMIKHVVRAPMSYFDTTPLARIVNRFSQDMDIIDGQIVYSAASFVKNTFSLIVSLIFISLEIPLILLAILPIIVLYIICQRIHIPSYRQIGRIKATTHSPIMSHFEESFSGTTTIRAFGSTDHFVRESHRHIDAYNACDYLSICADNWLKIRVQFLGNIIVLIVAVFAVMYKNNLSPGTAGLTLSYAINFIGILSILISIIGHLETHIVSIERCLQLMDVSVETELSKCDYKLAPDWPQSGQISFNKYSTRYRQGLDLVLKNITLDVNGGQRLAIVGRTGAGKSSLTLALFRLIEPTTGTFTIDGIDCSRIGLNDLRSRLTIIPQDPVLFAGTLRQNVDPFGNYTENEISDVLELAHLKTFVDNENIGLDYEIQENGENLSVGQKQLVCLARALLRKSMILVLDEATAAIDVETDEMIQKTIRREFQSSTVVTIAHRLNTIIDYDRVLVLDKGQVVEYDSPQRLLSDSNSLFYSMAKQENIV